MFPHWLQDRLIRGAILPPPIIISVPWNSDSWNIVSFIFQLLFLQISQFLFFQIESIFWMSSVYCLVFNFIAILYYLLNVVFEANALVSAFFVAADCLSTNSQVPLLLSNAHFPSNVVVYWLCACSTSDARIINSVKRNFITVRLVVVLSVNFTNILIFSNSYSEQ